MRNKHQSQLSGLATIGALQTQVLDANSDVLQALSGIVDSSG